MKKYALLLSFHLQDARYKLGTNLIPYVLLLAYLPCLALNRRLAYKLLLASHRANYNRVSAHLIRRNLDAIAHLIPAIHCPGQAEIAHIVSRSIVLKKPLMDGDDVEEKGIVLVKFTETFAYFLKYVDCERLLRHFHLVLEPSWTGQALEEVLGWTKYKHTPVYIQTSDDNDYRFIQRLNSNLVPIRSGASDFVDYRVFRPLGANKEYDCLYIANYTGHKRLHAYVLAIKKLAAIKPDIKAAMVCASWGGKKPRIHDLVASLGIEHNLRVFNGMNQSELNRLVDKSYVSVLLSYREGANKVLFESFFVDVPGIVLRENIGVNKDHFTEQTGRVVPEKHLPEAILEIRKHHARFSPRDWAMKNISPEVTLQKIANTICQHERQGKPFTSSLFVKVNTPEATYMHDYPDMDKERSKDIIAAFVNWNDGVGSLVGSEQGESALDSEFGGRVGRGNVPAS